jgi:hypothetical protein
MVLSYLVYSMFYINVCCLMVHPLLSVSMYC